MTKKVVGFGLAIMTTLLALLILWQFRIVIIYVLISLTLAAVIRPLIKHLDGKRILVRVAWILLYLVVLVSFGFLLFMSNKAAINEFQLLAQSVSVKDQWTLPIWLEGSSFQQVLITRLPAPSILLAAITGDQGQLVIPTILGFTKGIAGVITGAIVILFLSIYWIVNQIHFERLWLSLLPTGQRKQARGVWRTIEPDLGAYIRSQIIISLLAGLLLGLGYWLLGSPYPALLALFGAIACLIPLVGPVIAVIPPLLMGLLTGVQLSLFTELYTLIILGALIFWVKPRLFKHRWDNPIITLMMIIGMASAFGLLGIILAPPISAICQIMWKMLVSNRIASGAAVHVSDLKDRQENIWETIKAMDEPPPSLVTSSMQRLAHLIEKAEPVLQASLAIKPSAANDPQSVITDDTQPGEVEDDQTQNA